mgnify:CR=1 FL=1
MLMDIVLHAIATATGTALDSCVINSIKFLAPAGPGEELVIRHELSGSATIRFDIVTSTRKIASVTIAQ